MSLFKKKKNPCVGRATPSNHEQTRNYTFELDFPDGVVFLLDQCSQSLPNIKQVIYNAPATIVFWEDGTKTMAKTSGGDKYNPEMGLAVAICKKALGSKTSFKRTFDRWLPERDGDEYGECKNVTIGNAYREE